MKQVEIYRPDAGSRCDACAVSVTVALPGKTVANIPVALEANWPGGYVPTNKRMNVCQYHLDMLNKGFWQDKRDRRSGVERRARPGGRRENRDDRRKPQ